MARAAGSSGQSVASGHVSAAYSQMASDSQTVIAPCTRHGTLPFGETRRMFFFVSGRSSVMTSSVNSMPGTANASQGRSDHDEMRLSPMYNNGLCIVESAMLTPFLALSVGANTYVERCARGKR